MNITLRRLCLFLLLSSVSSSAWSQSKKKEEVAPAKKKESSSATKSADVATKHENLFSNLEFLKVDFKQTVHTSLRDKTRTREGQASFAKPGNFFWQFKDKKAVEEYYFDGKTLSHYRSNEKAVTHYGTKSGLQKELQAIVDLVLDAEKLLSQYDAVDVKTAKGVTSMKLIPKVKDQTDIVSISVQVSEKSKYVQDVKIEYKNGNYTAFTFQNPNTSPIPAKTFQFSDPGGVKVRRIG